MISTTKCRSFLLLALFLALPAPALAAVQLTEVMYDAPGSDAGNEWIEVTNTGSSTANLAGWKFYQGGTNHNLTIAQGTDSTSSPQATTLEAGMSAIIANDPAQFVVNFPNYAGAVFKSSFSLPNTSATLQLKDAKLNVVDSLSYDAKLGAGGDGNTLHLTAAGLASGAPDPGIWSKTPPKPIAKPAVVAAASVQKSSVQSAKTSSLHGTTPAPSTQTAITFQAGGNLPAPQSTWLEYALGFVAMVVLAITAAFYLKLESAPKSETSLAAEEFEIVE